ncbi:MAG: thioredoxin domain-containing protein [Mycobacteriales bacterium]
MEQVNRLGSATSPYLLQHKDNPVDWWEWSEEAFAEARRRDVPVLLSVGYAACHWCHVMAHESFEDPAIAALMNERFVSIKVDREERPDVDAVYMEATQAMTGGGGWPMTVFMTPDGAPFFCGTYFPPIAGSGMPSFREVLDAVTESWQQRRTELSEHAQSVIAQLAERGFPPAQPVDGAALAAGASTLRQNFDARNGGFGRAPKFPQPLALEFLLRYVARTGDPDSLAVVTKTAEAMARGGIYDQLAGGFARYSVDAGWVVPHFEKMLYDNAQLLRFYARLHRQTQEPLAERVARETADFLLRELRTGEGGFASALDADTDGVEGLTYVWTPQQLTDLLGEDDGLWAATGLSVTREGTFEGGASTLQLRADPPDAEKWHAIRARMLRARNARPQPARDDKVVTSWNGLAIGALAETAAVLDEPKYAGSAAAAADHVLSVHMVDGRLRRAARAGVAGASAGVLDDYGNLAEGLLALHQVDGNPRWLDSAGGLLDTAMEHFAAGDGGYFDTADDAERLVRRPRELTDNPTPAGFSALAGALTTYAALTGSTRHRTLAEAAVAGAAALVAGYPQAAGWTAAIGEALLAGPLQVAVVGPVEERHELERAARLTISPGAVVIAGLPDTPGIPLLADRPLVDGRPAAYVCRGFVCDAPVTTVDGLRAATGLNM